MYAFIFYGTYRALNFTILSKGKEKQEDRRISATTITALSMLLNIATIFGILAHRLNMELTILKDYEYGKLITIILCILLFLYNKLFYERKLNILSKKYKAIYDENKHLDKWVGFGLPFLSLIIFFVFGTP